MSENFIILIEIFANDIINNYQASVQIMAWWRKGNKAFS